MRLPQSVILALGMVGLASCAYVQKGDENQVEVGHSPLMTSFAAIKAKAETHCAEFHKRAVLQAALTADNALFRCEEGEADAAKPAQPAGTTPAETTGQPAAAAAPRTVMTAPAPGPNGSQPGVPQGYPTYVYPQGAMPYPQGGYPQGGYPQAYMAVPPQYMQVPPGYAPVPQQYAPAQQPLQQPGQPQSSSRGQRRAANAGARSAPQTAPAAGAPMMVQPPVVAVPMPPQASGPAAGAQPPAAQSSTPAAASPRPASPTAASPTTAGPTAASPTQAPLQPGTALTTR